MIPAVVLAAGESSRFGRPKQLLTYRGRTLLRHTVECATDGGCAPIFVVLGAHAEQLRADLATTDARVVLNERWRRGLGTSVSAGVRAVRAACPAAGGVLLLACDQPLLTSPVVRNLCRRFETGEARLAACAYAGTVGIPAVFGPTLFDALTKLSGHRGAKSVLETHADEVLRLDWPEGAIDVDTPEDFESLGPR